MIPYFLIGIGIILIAWSAWGFIRLLFLPFSRMSSVVFKRKDDFLKYESKEGHKYFKTNLKQLTWAFVGLFIAGISCFLIGVYLGYAAKGPGFWFYEKMFGPVETPYYSEKLTDDGKYVSTDGDEYPYYIIVDGNEYIFNGELCANEKELESMLDDIGRKELSFGGVILIDNFGVASKYHDAVKLLKEKGVVPKIEESSER